MQDGRVGCCERAGERDIAKLVCDTLYSLVKRVNLESAISIALHDGLDESRHEVPLGSGGGNRQASHGESRSQVGKVDPPQAVKAPVEVEYDNLCQLVSGQAGDATIRCEKNVAYTLTEGMFVPARPVLVDTVTSTPQESVHGTDESALAGDTVGHGTAGHGRDEMLKVGVQKVITNLERSENAMWRIAAGLNVTGKDTRDFAGNFRDTALGGVARHRNRGDGSLRGRGAPIDVEHHVERGTGRRFDKVRAGFTGARLRKLERGTQEAFVV
jgi:hypothetical protein